MKIWQLDADVDNYDNFTTIKKEDLSKFDFDGSHLIESWEPVAVRVIEEIKVSDSPGLSSGAPVMSERAVEILRELMGSSVEILPLRYRKGDYYAINVTDVLSCINYDEAEYKLFSSSNRIMRFIKYSFKEHILKDKHIFKIVDEPRRRPFVSDVFRRKVLDEGLEGFYFKLVWDSEVE
jgi:hypothetical protein